MDKFKLSENFIEQYKNKKAPFGFNGLGELVYIRTYSRIKDDGTNEQWWETCRRVVEGTYTMQKKHIEEYSLGWNAWQAQKSAQEMFDRIFNMKFLPPGRGLWAMGSPITEEKGIFAALNNCAFVSTVNIKDELSKPFIFLMDMSMLGVGVGFDTLGAGQIIIKGQNNKRNPEIYKIPDTRDGWVESVKMLIESYFLGMADVQFDYSEIRKEGELIKGFGGLSSGYKPLEELHKNIRKTMDKEISQPISITTIVDIMNHIGKCVVSGNVRRSAQIIFGDPANTEYINLKNYKLNPHRELYGWASNNSVFAKIGMNYNLIFERIIDNGEPGLAWLDNMKGYSKMDNGPDYKDNRVVGANPCCVVGNTLVAVADGRNAVAIKDLVGTTYSVYTVKDGKVTIGKSIKTWKTRENVEVWKLTLDDDSYILLTPDHLIMLRNGDYKQLKDLTAGESLMPFNSRQEHIYRQILSNVGKDRRQYRLIAEDNGLIVDAKINAIHHKDMNSFNDRIENLCVISHEEHKKIHDISGEKNPIFKLKANPEKWKEYLIKLSSALSGKNNPMYNKIHNDKTKKIIGEKSKNNWKNQHEYMSSKIKLGMESQDVRKKISLSRINNSEYFDFTCPVCFKKIKHLTKHVYNKKVTCSHSCSNIRRSRIKNNTWNHKVKQIEFYGYEDVYDMMVEDTHNFGVITSFVDSKYITSSGIFIHNCEQSLESYEVCNLVETFPYRHIDLEDYKRTLKFAYLYAKTVTLGKTHWSDTNRVMLRNRRIGCSVSGIQQFVVKNGLDVLKTWLTEGYKVIQHWDKIYSDWLVIPKSIKVTSIKPSGTTSLLVGATPGMHWPKSKYYIRRVRLSKNSDLVKSLEKANYIIEPCFGSEDTTVVVEIPVYVGENIRPECEVSMWEQLSMAAFLQKYWSDNQVSVTISFDPEREGGQIPYALDYFQYQLKGVSFLPNIKGGVYKQMPYEEVTEEEYKKSVSRLKKINFSKIKNEIADVDKFCDNESCELPT